jgi:ABC-type phosphate transport system substrate-binding protein
MSRILILFLWACFGIFAPTAYADSVPEQQDSTVVTGGGAHFAWVIFDQLKADLERVTGHSIELHGRNSALGMGCNAGIKIALQNATGHETFGFVCCPLSKEEITRKQLKVYPLALEPIMIIVHHDNPVSNLSSEQVRAIMHGDITNWQKVGGRDEPIVLVTRLHCKKRPGHWKTILPDAKEFREKRLNVSSAADMEQTVGDFKGAIGHIGSTWDFTADNHLKVVTVDGYEPTAENLHNKHYPFFRNLSAVTDQHPSDAVLTLIREVQTGPAFAAVAKRYGLLRIDSSVPSAMP